MKNWKYVDSSNQVVYFGNESASIHAVEVQEWLAAGNTPTPADVPTLAQVKAAQITKINQAADNAFDTITSAYPKQEVATWPSQLNEAKAFKLDALAATPTISVIASASGLTKLAVADSILEKAALFHGVSGQIVGKRKKLTALINAATTNADAEAVVW